MDELISKAGNKIVPNSYQVPNIFVDQLMYYLTPEEWVVLSYATRQILGFQDKISARQAHISFTSFTDGREGTMGCGLSIEAIKRALSGLGAFSILVPVGKANGHGQLFELVDNDARIDWTGLKARQEEKSAKHRKIISKARATRKSKRSVTQNDNERSVEQNGSVLSDRTQAFCQTETLKTNLKTNSKTKTRESSQNSQPPLLEETPRVDPDGFDHAHPEDWFNAHEKRDESLERRPLEESVAIGNENARKRKGDQSHFSARAAPYAEKFIDRFGRGPTKKEVADWNVTFNTWADMGIPVDKVEPMYAHAFESGLSVTRPGSITFAFDVIRQKKQEVKRDPDVAPEGYYWQDLPWGGRVLAQILDPKKGRIVGMNFNPAQT